ncbi:MAG: peptidylprolyl isomerase [bacterium]
MLKENKGYIFSLVAIFILFLITFVLLTQSRQNPYFFSKALVPFTDYIYNKKTIVINISKNYLLTLNTNKGPVIIELYSPNAPYNVNNVYKLATSNSFDSKPLILENGLLNLNSKLLKENVFDEMNQSSLKLSPIVISALTKAGYVSDSNVKSILFEQYSFGVKIDSKDSSKNKFFIIVDASKAKELDGYATNIGVVISGKEILSSSNLTVLSSSINEK